MNPSPANENGSPESKARDGDGNKADLYGNKASHSDLFLTAGRGGKCSPEMSHTMRSFYLLPPSPLPHDSTIPFQI